MIERSLLNRPNSSARLVLYDTSQVICGLAYRSIWIVGLLKVARGSFPKKPAFGPLRLMFDVKKNRSCWDTMTSFPTRPYVPRIFNSGITFSRPAQNFSFDSCHPAPMDGKNPHRNLGSNRSEPLRPKLNSTKYFWSSP